METKTIAKAEVKALGRGYQIIHLTFTDGTKAKANDAHDTLSIAKKEYKNIAGQKAVVDAYSAVYSGGCFNVFHYEAMLISDSRAESLVASPEEALQNAKTKILNHIEEQYQEELEDLEDYR